MLQVVSIQLRNHNFKAWDLIKSLFLVPICYLSITWMLYLDDKRITDYLEAFHLTAQKFTRKRNKHWQTFLKAVKQKVNIVPTSKSSSSCCSHFGYFFYNRRKNGQDHLMVTSYLECLEGRPSRWCLPGGQDMFLDKKVVEVWLMDSLCVEVHLHCPACRKVWGRMGS